MRVHMFWAYGPFSKLEELCARSFVVQGYELTLWTYGEGGNVPSGVEVRDAREIVDEGMVFLNRLGSYAGFSDLFRYAVLSQMGGLYVDTDVVALCPHSILPAGSFLVSERSERPGIRERLKAVLGRAPRTSLNGNVIHNPSPREGDLIDLAYAYSSRFPKHQIRWSEIGPSLLSALVQINPEHGFSIMPPEFANPIDYWNCPAHLLEPGRHPPDGSAFLHLYNEMWRRAGVDKNADYPAGSIMAHLEQTAC